MRKSSIILISLSFLVGIGFFGLEKKAHAATILSQDVSPASIQDTNVTGSPQDSIQDTFASNTPGQVTLLSLCGMQGFDVTASIASTTSTSSFSLVLATFKFGDLSLSAQNIAPKASAGGCALSVEAWRAGVLSTQVSGVYTLKFTLPASEYDRFVQGQLSIYSFSTSTNQWTELASVARDDTAHTLSAQLDHFTLFAALGTLRTLTAATPIASAGNSQSGGSGISRFPLGAIAAIPGAPFNLPGLIGLIPSIISLVPSIPSGVPSNIPPRTPVNPTALSLPPSSSLSRPLFDIRVVTTRESYTTTEQPELHIIFDNFGNTPTKIDFEINLSDSSGRIIQTVKDSIVVETTGLYVAKFKPLGVGIYHAEVKTQYAHTVRDVFRASFSIREAPSEGVSFWQLFMFWLKAMPWTGWIFFIMAILSLIGALVALLI